MDYESSGPTVGPININHVRTPIPRECDWLWQEWTGEDTFRSHSGHTDLVQKETPYRLFLRSEILVERSTTPLKASRVPHTSEQRIWWGGWGSYCRYIVSSFLTSAHACGKMPVITISWSALFVSSSNFSTVYAPHLLCAKSWRAPMTNVCTPLAKIAPQHMGHGSKVV